MCADNGRILEALLRAIYDIDGLQERETGTYIERQTDRQSRGNMSRLDDIFVLLREYFILNISYLITVVNFVFCIFSYLSQTL